MAWEPPKRRIEREYQSILDRVIKNALSVMSDDPERMLDRLREFFQTKDFIDFIRKAAYRMVTSVRIDGYHQWKDALEYNRQESQLIGEMLRSELEGPVGRVFERIVEENIKQIKRLPDHVLLDISNIVKESIVAGARSSQISEVIKKKFPSAIHSRVALIARTETSRATTALTRARSEVLDLPFYVWRTSKDGRVRSSHRMMEGVIIPWSEPPAPEILRGVKSTLGHYHAGDAPNDRCYAEPLVSTNQVSWPHKVYSSGQIRFMTLAQFKNLYGKEVEEAA